MGFEFFAHAHTHTQTHTRTKGFKAQKGLKYMIDLQPLQTLMFKHYWSFRVKTDKVMKKTQLWSTGF